MPRPASLTGKSSSEVQEATYIRSASTHPHETVCEFLMRSSMNGEMMREYFKSPRRRIMLGIAISLLLVGTAVLLINTFVFWRQPCPDGWSCQDIGNPQPAGSETVSGGTWTIQASGTGIGTSSADQFRFGRHSVSGDTQITAQLAKPSSGAIPQAGLMLRQTYDPGSPYVAVLASPQHRLVVEYRLAFDGPITVTSTTALHALPL